MSVRANAQRAAKNKGAKVKRAGACPMWVETYDVIARWDADLETVFCRVCRTELHVFAHAEEHAVRHIAEGKS